MEMGRDTPLSRVPISIPSEVLAVIKEFCQRGGKYTMKLPMQEIWDQPPGTHLVAVDKTDDQYQFVLQCELRLQNEERSLWKGLASFISIADWYGDRPFWLVHAMDYRGRIYPISSLLNYMRADPYRACFNFREGRKLGGKQVDGYTGFEWLLIHTVVISERKKKVIIVLIIRSKADNCGSTKNVNKQLCSF